MTEIERDRDKETKGRDRGIDRETGRERETDRQADEETEKQRDREKRDREIQLTIKIPGKAGQPNQLLINCFRVFGLSRRFIKN